MLFHALVAPESIAYFVQLTQVLEGELDVARFKTAWEQTAARHAVLRTRVPLRRGSTSRSRSCGARSPCPLREQDWRGAPAAEQAARLAAFLAADRARRVDLARPPPGAWP